MERPFQSQRKFDKVFRLLTKNKEELLKNFNEQEKELFNKVKACYDEMIQIPLKYQANLCCLCTLSLPGRKAKARAKM